MALAALNRRQISRACLATVTVATLVTLGACGTKETAKSSNLVALSTQLRGANEVPPNSRTGGGTVDAVLNRDTNLLRWKVNYTGLSGPATAGHFHGPAGVGANAGVVLPWSGTMASPMEGSATLTPTQVGDLMAGLWYANIHTAAHPGGELRGQMTIRN
ncbi:MAG: domain containing protein [Polaromonas sp.]|nr:domain containing protein [Polaromonas sp.]